MTQLVSLAVSRVVPLLLVTTLVLVAARLVADRVASGERINRIIFGGLLALGLLLQAPAALRSVALVRTERAILRRDVEGAASALAEFRRLGGTLGPFRTARWMGFLVHERRWAASRQLALDTLADPRPKSRRYLSDLRICLGIASYYQGETGEAAASLREADDPTPAYLYLARYFEGRLAERRGAIPEAVGAYSASLEKDPAFRPALYQLVRLLAAAAGRDAAKDALSKVLAAAPRSPSDPLVLTLEAHLAAGTLPPEKEFEIVLP